MTFARLGRMVGKATSTAGYWSEISHHPHTLGLVCLLERLSEEGQARFLRSVCRAMPTVLHPSVAHSPRTVVDLLETLQNPCGLTLIRGGTLTSRSYLIAALGHTFPQMHPRHTAATGLDICPPDKIVPVETMRYLSGSSPDKLHEAILGAWPQIFRSSSPIILLHGIWSAAPGIREQILQCAKARHVVLADTSLPDLDQVAEKGIQPLQVFTLAQSEPPNRIYLSRKVWKSHGRPLKKCG